MIEYNTLKEKADRITLNGEWIKGGRNSFPFNESLYESGKWNEAGTEFSIGTDRYCFYQNVGIDIDTSPIFRDLSCLEDWVDTASLNAVLCSLEKADKIIIGSPEGPILAELDKEYHYSLDYELRGENGDIDYGFDESSFSSCCLFGARFNGFNEETEQETTGEVVVYAFSFLLNATTCNGYGKGIEFIDEGFVCEAVLQEEEDFDPEEAVVYFCPVKTIISQ